jgi:hypothetical protein
VTPSGADQSRTYSLSEGQAPHLAVAVCMILMSIITCPQCGHSALERMPLNVCQIFYDCRGCGARLKPKTGDCCVFCSYGSVPCPPVQAKQTDVQQ